MSLQLAAQHMASRGRGPDTTLVHMAPQEVAGLQALAKAHGGSLTINPDTGLPEAGFLSSILPMVAGAGLSLMGVPPPMAAAIVGAGTGVATGSLQKGLMAGLGAYGGAGLAGGLTTAGTGALSSAAGATAANSVVPSVATEAVAPALVEGAGSAAGTQLGSTLANPTGIPGFTGTNLGLTPAASPINAGEMVAQATPTITQAPALTQQAADIGNIYAQEQAAQNAVAKTLAGTSPFDTAKAGLGEVMKDPSRFMTKENLKYGLMGLAPVAMDMLTPKQREAEEKAKLQPKNYSFAYNQRANPQQDYTGAYTGERTYFNPIYTPISAAGGGLMDTGPVQAMSDQNAAETLRANNWQMFAEGGETKAVKSVEEDPYYTMSGQSGDAFKYLMGQMPAQAKAPAAATAPAVVQSTVQPTAAPESSSPFFNLFGGLGGLGQTMSPEAQAAGGEWVDDTSGNIRPYTFDPATGTFAAAAPRKVFRPYTSAPTSSATAAEMTSAQRANLDGIGGFAQGGIASLAQGGQSHLGDYSDGGRLLKGPGDGVSDSIPATIANKRPARLADGEFVVPARIVSELGNGSTEAGARKLYAMMDRVQKARKKSIGKNRVAVNSRADKLLPA